VPVEVRVETLRAAVPLAWRPLMISSGAVQWGRALHLGEADMGLAHRSATAMRDAVGCATGQSRGDGHFATVAAARQALHTIPSPCRCLGSADYPGVTPGPGRSVDASELAVEEGLGGAGGCGVVFPAEVERGEAGCGRLGERVDVGAS